MASIDQNQAHEQVLQTWLHDTGKLLLEERERTRDLEAALVQAERQAREMESRNWLLEQTVDMLKQELRELAARYEQAQLELRNAQLALRQQASVEPEHSAWVATSAVPTVPPIAPAIAAPRIRPANQRTPAPGHPAPTVGGRGAQAPQRRRR